MKSRHSNVGRYFAITLVGLATAFPLLYLLSGSLMTYREIIGYPPGLIPIDPQWSNYAEAMDYLTPRAIVNSFIFVVGTLMLQLAVCLPAGFALAKIRFKGAGALLVFFVIPVVMPTNLMLIPTFIVTLKLGLYGSFLGMILPVAGQASIAVLLFRQFFAGLPDGLFEAARLDGASWFQSFARIALPLARPVVASYSVITFFTGWNMYIWPLIASGGSANLRVLTVAVAPLATSQYSTIISPAVGFAAAVISMLPVLVVFVAFQRWFTKGVVGTGLE